MWEWWVKHLPDILKLAGVAVSIITATYNLLKKFHTQRKSQMEQIQEQINKLEENDAKQTRTNLALLHNQIYGQCKEYITQGWVGITALQNLDKMYASYKENGGNGTAETLHTEVHKLQKKKVEV